MRTLGLVLFAALCAHPARAAGPEPVPVRIEVPKAGNLQFLTLWVALGAHLFEKEGLAPQVIIDPTPRDAGRLLLAGRADIALLQPPMFLGMMAENEPIVLFASLLANEPINLIVRKDVAAARKLDARSSLKDRLQTVRGLRIGVADGPPPRLRALFASVGMDADRDITMVVIDGPDQVAALRAGKVDALFAHTPYLETALIDDGAVLLVNQSAGEVAALADGQVHALATTRDQARDHPDRVTAVTRAVAGALRLIHTDSAASVDAVMASGTTDVDRAHVAALVAIYAAAVPVTPRVSADGIARDVALYPAFPRKPDFAVTPVTAFVAPRFADQAGR